MEAEEWPGEVWEGEKTRSSWVGGCGGGGSGRRRGRGSEGRTVVVLVVGFGVGVVVGVDGIDGTAGLVGK